MKVASASIVLLALILTMVSDRPANAADPAAAPKQFMARMKCSELVDGKLKVVAEPTLTSEDGKEARFLSGGQILVDKATDERLSFGLEVGIQVREVKPNELRVSLCANKSDLVDAPAEGDVVIRDHGVRVLKTVKPGGTIDLDLGDGRTVSVTIDRAERVQ